MSRRSFMLYLALIVIILLAGASTLPSAKLPNIPPSQFNYPLGLALALAGGLVVALWKGPDWKTLPAWAGALMTAAVSICCSFLLRHVEDDFARDLTSLLPVLWWAALAMQNHSGACRGEHDDMYIGLVWFVWALSYMEYGWWTGAAFGLLVLLWAGCRVRSLSLLANSAGAALVILCVLVLTSSYRRVKLLGWIYGEFMFIRSFEHEQIRLALQQTPTNLWGGADEFLLTVLALEAGTITAWLTAVLSAGLLTWSIIVLTKARPMWQRSLGLWVAGYLLLVAIFDSLTSLGIGRFPRTPGLPFFSPGYGLFLWCGVLVGAVHAAGRQGRTESPRPQQTLSRRR